MKEEPVVYHRPLAEFTRDPRNANLGTDQGRAMIRHSLEQRGAARSIVVDRQGRIIAGNKTAEQAKAAGISDVIVVKTKGDVLVAVERTDLDLASDEKARLLAYDDNRTAEEDLKWDYDVLTEDRGAIEELRELFPDEYMEQLEAQLSTDTGFLERHVSEAESELKDREVEDGWGQRAGGAAGGTGAPDMVQLLFVLTPGDRDAVVDRLRKIKNDQEFATNAEALLYGLGIG